MGLIIAITIAIGLYVLNSVIDFYYKVELLKTPCELCVELNPEWERCYKFVTAPQIIEKNYSFNPALLNISLTSP